MGVRSIFTALNRNSEPPAIATIRSPKRGGIPEADPSKAALVTRQRVGIPEADPSEAALATRRSNLNQWANALCLLLGDTLAFAAAVAVGGIVAYAVSSYLLATRYLAFEEPGLIQQLIVLACVAAGLCAWFARSGHYTERRLFRMDLGEILNACVVGLLITGFVEYANKTSFSRLWVVFAWVFAAISIPLARIACRLILNAFGMWKVNAVIMGKGAHGVTVTDLLLRRRLLWIQGRCGCSSGILCQPVA